MTDELDTVIRSFVVELVDAAPTPPEYDAIDQSRFVHVSLSDGSAPALPGGAP